MGEYLAKHLTQGEKVVVSGRLKWREYEVDGKPRQAVDITADSVIPIPRSDSAQAADATPAADDDIAF